MALLDMESLTYYLQYIEQAQAICQLGANVRTGSRRAMFDSRFDPLTETSMSGSRFVIALALLALLAAAWILIGVPNF